MSMLELDEQLLEREKKRPHEEGRILMLAQVVTLAVLVMAVSRATQGRYEFSGAPYI